MQTQKKESLDCVWRGTVRRSLNSTRKLSSELSLELRVTPRQSVTSPRANADQRRAARTVAHSRHPLPLTTYAAQ